VSDIKKSFVFIKIDSSEMTRPFQAGSSFSGPAGINPEFKPFTPAKQGCIDLF
jgi:hypothetical protein